MIDYLRSYFQIIIFTCLILIKGATIDANNSLMNSTRLDFLVNDRYQRITSYHEHQAS